MGAHAVVLILTVAALAAACSSAAAEGVSFWPSNSAVKLLRDAKPGPADPLRFAGAAGEVVSAQAAIRSDAALAGARASITDLAGPAGTIPASAVTLQWVRYIDVKRNSQGLPDDVLVAKAPCSIPDPFWEAPTLDLAANQTQPLWIEIAVPSDAKPGDYSGTLTCSWTGGSATLPVRLTVFGFAMPAKRHQQVTNWFPFPGEGYKVAQGSPEYWELASKFARFMVAHRQTCFRADLSSITTTYDAASRNYQCDFTYLDKWADTFFGAGMERIELFQAGTISASVVEPTARISPVDLPVTVRGPAAELTPEDKLRGVLGELEKHIKERGWAGKVMLHIMDEPFPGCVPTYRAVAKIVHEAAPSVKVIEAMESTGFGDAIDVMVPKLSHLNLWHPYFQKAHTGGRELWFYTCCHPMGRYPNRFLDQPLVLARMLHWIGYLYGLDGYLHWGLCYFAEGVDPYSEEGISKDLPLGDRAVMYPGKNGPVGSLRFSAMRDGLQDFEYLWTLEDTVRKLGARVQAEADWLDPRQRPLELCRRVVQSFYNPSGDADSLLATRETVGREIEALASGKGLYVQTEPSEGTEVPAGPRMVIVHGIAEPGAEVTINGEKCVNVSPSGAFTAHCFPEKPMVVIRATKGGRAVEVTRAFRFVE